MLDVWFLCWLLFAGTVLSFTSVYFGSEVLANATRDMEGTPQYVLKNTHISPFETTLQAIWKQIWDIIRESHEYNNPKLCGLRLSGMVNRRLCEICAVSLATYLWIYSMKDWDVDSKEKFLNRLSETLDWSIPEVSRN